MSILMLTLVGGLSWYYPGDGHCGSNLSCGGKFKKDQHHIAIRQWRRRCGQKAVVCSRVTEKCVWTKVKDSGPWGATDGSKWEVQIRLKRGWRYRGVVDVTVPVWKELGKPPFLSPVFVWVPK